MATGASAKAAGTPFAQASQNHALARDRAGLKMGARMQPQTLEGRVERLEDRMTGMEERIDGLSSDVRVLTTRVDTLSTDVRAIGEDLRAEIRSLGTQIHTDLKQNRDHARALFEDAIERIAITKEGHDRLPDTR